MEKVLNINDLEAILDKIYDKENEITSLCEMCKNFDIKVDKDKINSLRKELNFERSTTLATIESLKENCCHNYEELGCGHRTTFYRCSKCHNTFEE